LRITSFVRGLSSAASSSTENAKSASSRSTSGTGVAPANRIADS
jgi:hypothetical protein